MRRLLLSLLLLSPSGIAAQLTSPQGTYDAVPGAFVSVPVIGDGDLALSADAPDFLSVVGAPQLREGRGLVNLLVDRHAPAGEHQVTISADGVPLTVVVRVAAQYGLELRSPEGQTIVGGESVTYMVLVSNTGNAPATVILEVDSRLSAELSTTRLELGMGESREVELRLTSARGSAGRDTAVLTASAQEDESVRQFAAIRTELLPFAGAAGLEGPVLRYRLDAGATYGSADLSYQATAAMAGQLSDFVDADVLLTLRAPQGADPTIAGHAALEGDGWRAGYRASRSTHRLEVRYHDVRGYASLAPRSFGFGVSYSPSPLTLSFDYQGGAVNRQTLTARYRFQVLRGLSLSPSLSLQRRVVESSADVRSALGLVAEIQTAPIIGVARVRVPLPFDDSWFLSTSLSSRIRSPFGVQVDATWGANGISTSVIANQDVGEEVSFHQRLSYSGGRGPDSDSGSLDLGVRYRSRLIPLTLGADVGATLGRGGFGLRYGASANYRPSPFSVGAYFSGSGAGDWAYGGSLGYRDGVWGAHVAYAHSTRLDRLSASLAASLEGFTGSATYSYELNSSQHRGSVGLQYEFPQGHRLFSDLTVGESIRWQLGASVMLVGGFATPGGVVNTFGGRAVGFVEGVLFHDQNRNGVHDADEPTLPGATVLAGGVSATAGADGGFRLALVPGEYTISVQGLSASYGLMRPRELVVELGETYVANVPVETVATMIIRVFDDRDRDGAPAPGESLLPLAAVSIQGPDGLNLRRLADSRGEAVFQNLPPGRYSVALELDSLPRFYEPTSEPLSVALEPGPIMRLELGAAERPKDIVQTLRTGDLTLIARVEPMPAPPGADVLITAEVGGEPESVVAHLPSGASVALQLENGSYVGRLSLPLDAQGVMMITVEARRGEVARSQQVPLIVSPGPLAQVTTVPTLAEPGESVRVEATLLTLVAAVEVVVDGAKYVLGATDDPYRFVGTLPAPTEAGSYPVEMFGDGEKMAETRFRVQ